MSSVIQKEILLKAPVSRVWQAIADSKQFGEWFRVQFHEPFVAGKPAIGKILLPNYEHLHFEFTVQKIEPERYFSYTWNPYAVDDKVGYSQETPTLVEFILEKASSGTLLTVRESGFENVPAHRRDEAFRMNDNGWAAQIKNIEAYLASHV